MRAQETLKRFKARLDPRIAAFFDTVEADARKEDALVTEALRHVREIALAGGKRLRAANLYFAYQAGGGKDDAAILDTAVAIEVMHLFLLVHDDIIDRDDIRHGVPTLHRRYADFGQRHFPRRDSAHFGNSIALIVGDMLFALGNDILFRAPFPKERIFEALSTMQQIVSYTVIGQARDIYLEYHREGSAEEVTQMYKNKTARYTMDGPIQIGLSLAGAKTDLKLPFTDFALPLGVAFQIQDDILGVFGDEERLGKPVGSDVQEGKVTLLVAYALSDGTASEKKELSRLLALGERLTKNDLERFRELIRSSGALQRASALAHSYIVAGQAALDAVATELPQPARDYFSGIATYMAERQY